MNSLDLIKMGSSNLFRRKLRTFLTTLGIVIGTISIVVMISLGIGMKENYKKSLERMGSLDVIDVRPSYDRHSRRDDDNKLKDEDIEKIAAIEGVKAVTPYMEMQIHMKSGKYGTWVRMIGLRPEYMEEFGFKVSEGRLLNKDDVVDSGMVAVFGSKLPEMFRNERSKNRNMYDDFYDDAEGEKKEPNVNIFEDRITFEFQQDYDRNQRRVKRKSKPIRPFKIQAVGIFAENGDWETRRSIFVPIDTLKAFKKKYDRMAGNHRSKDAGYDEVKVKVVDIKRVVAITKELKKMGYEANSMMEYVEESNKMTNIIQLIFGGIGAISLLVAAIGITNTMIMAIYERRKEIGVMKVIGASLRDIKKLFLFEASMIGFMGGILGLVLSIFASKALNMLVASKMAGQMEPDTVISIVPIWLAVAAVGFTTVIGLVSGYLPARKAMKLSALEAIKTE
ncbi:macrolide export ATP-binding/permease protein MacB [Clostridium tepidiprofundi DSM 19306]|uniref:Macrolide export ATP-binding/permease protein MacB n=1 Tax=Clostridium tepidiprofundi DSM 19306 TaxID=1121338 RepID=A0A151B3I4_9CLOT|nr:FtsX-like permease family protein [Clostridium tepidiprofundi]KYH34456.1 macrolide export ATP-binding/permease protein MacB [Clostridium tepidiprofundi DSM 19306]